MDKTKKKSIIQGIWVKDDVGTTIDLTTRGFQAVSFEQFKKDYLKDIGDTPVDIIHRSYVSLLMPRRATPGSAGYDFYLPILGGIELKPGDSMTIPTGIKSYMPINEFVGILPRSGHGFKFFLRLANTEGVIDSDYYNNSDNEGHIKVKIRNEGDKVFKVDYGKGFCQGIFKDYKLTDDDDPVVKERAGGIGHSDKSGR